MNVLHIGPLTSVHTQIAALTYKSLGYPATFLNARKDVHLGRVPGVPEAGEVVNPWEHTHPIVPGAKRGSSVAASFVTSGRYLGIRDATLWEALSRLRKTRRFDVIVGTWGLACLEPMLAAQRLFRESAFVHNILTYPKLPPDGSGWRIRAWQEYLRWFDRLERAAYRRMLSQCDLRVHCSERMLGYLKHHGLLDGPGVDIVRVERFNRAFFPKCRKAKLSASDGEPHLVHLGATNFSGQSLDDLSGHFHRIAAARIHIHWPESTARSSVESRFWHPFPKFANDVIDSDLADFATQFDAAVLLYNVPRAPDAFINALPTRFLFALTIGIPIVVPNGLFGSCQDYVERHRIGFVYRSETELARLLGDRSLMEEVARNALAHSSQLSVEDDLNTYEAMFQQALSLRRRRTRSLDGVVS